MCKILKKNLKKHQFFFFSESSGCDGAAIPTLVKYSPKEKKNETPPKKTTTLELVPKQNEEKKEAEEKKVASNRTSLLQSGQDRQNALKEPVSCTAFSHYGQTRACTCRKPERSSCFTALCFCVGFRPPALAEEDPEPELNQGESGRRRK